MSWLSKNASKIGGAAIGFVTGGPIGAVTGFMATPGRSARPPVSQAGPGGAISGIVGAIGQVTGAAGRVIRSPFTGSSYGRGGVSPDGRGQCPRGYHFAKDGSGRCVRNRYMNVANPRALRRGMRRVEGFASLAKRTIAFTKSTRMKRGKKCR